MIGRWLLVAVVLLLLVPFRGRAGEAYAESVVRVVVTSQPYDFHRPWQKERPRRRGALGVLLQGSRVLVPGDLVEDASYIELEQVESGAKQTAVVETVDYVANLALLRPEGDGFLEAMKPVKVARRVKLDADVEAVQFSANDVVTVTEGRVADAEVVGYPRGVGAFLAFRVELPLAQDVQYTIPLFRKGQLVGLLMSYDSGTRMATVLPMPVIHHFLADAEDGTYDGFPRVGLGFAPIEDPQLRSYLAMGALDSGVFVTEVEPGGSADLAGIRSGDVLLAVDGFDVDKFGQYQDSEYEKLSLSHLTSCLSFVGDTREFLVLRDGQRRTLQVRLTARDPQAFPVPPFVVDRAPWYLIAGGLLFQELTGEYLKLWAGKPGPPLLQHYQRKQWDLLKSGERAVILSQVFRTPGNVGYGDLGALVVESVNGTPIRGIRQLAQVFAEPPADGFFRVTFADRYPSEIILHAAAIRHENARVQQVFGLPPDGLSRLPPDE